MTRHHLTWRRDPTSYIEGRYQVRYDLRPIGLVAETSREWKWALRVPGFLIPPWGAGQAASFDDSKVAFLQAWIEFYLKLGPSLEEHWRLSEHSNRTVSLQVPNSSRPHAAHLENGGPLKQKHEIMDGQPNARAIAPVTELVRDRLREAGEYEIALIRHLIGE